MKKFTLLGIIAMISFAACKKGDIQVSKQNRKQTVMSGAQPAVLSIDSFSDYQSIVEQPKGSAISNAPPNFVSLASIIPFRHLKLA